MSSATSKRRQGPLRQLSLQSPQHVTSRGHLRKQLSEDGGQSNHLIPCWSDGTGLRVTSHSTKNSGSHPQDKRHVIVGRTGGYSGRPRPIKVAWAEVKQQSQDLGGNGVEVIARKCSGQPRPGTAKPNKPHLPSIGDKDTILYSRQQLAERLRKVWQEREQSRNNIDIFLAHNSSDSGVCDEESSVVSGTPLPNKILLNSEETCDVESANQSSASVPETKTYIPSQYPQRQATTCSTLRPSNTAQNVKQSSNDRLFTTTVSKPQQEKYLSDTKATTFKDQMSLKQTVRKDIQQVNTVMNASVKYETVCQKSIIPFLGPEHKTLQQKTDVNFVHSVLTVNTNTSVISSSQIQDNVVKNVQNMSSSNSQLSLSDEKCDKDAFKSDIIIHKVSDERMVVEGAVKMSQDIEETQVDAIINMEVSISASPTLSISSQDSTSLESDLPESDAMGEDMTSSTSADKVELELTKPTVINASARRVIFRNSVNKAITSSFSSDTGQKESHPIEPPPLCRASSAPPQKFVPNSRRKPPLQTSFSVEGDVREDARVERQTKSAPPRRPKLKTTRRRGKSRDDEDASDDEEDRKIAAPKGRKAQGRGAEVVTMVSLMSPNGSDNEDAESSEFLPTPVDHIAPWFEDRNNGRNEGPKTQPTGVTLLAPRIVCLRKSPKSVSFQNQPSLSGGRSYTSLFPVRRGSVMGSLLSPASVVSTPNNAERDRRLQGGDSLGSRRRLVRTRSFPAQDPTGAASSPSDPEPSSASPNMAEPRPPSPPISVEDTQVAPQSAPLAQAVNTSSAIEEGNTDETSEEPVFQNPKEKECWQMYKKMSEKGVSVSYETVLRGMLTPTEYRLRKKAILNISCS